MRTRKRSTPARAARSSQAGEGEATGLVFAALLLVAGFAAWQFFFVRPTVPVSMHSPRAMPRTASGTVEAKGSALAPPVSGDASDEPAPRAEAVTGTARPNDAPGAVPTPARAEREAGQAAAGSASSASAESADARKAQPKREIDPRFEPLVNACRSLGMDEAKTAIVIDTLTAFEAEAQGYESLPVTEREELLRRRALETLDQLRAEVGAREVNHLMSLELLKPIYRHAFRSRPTVYPPPVADK